MRVCILTSAHPAKDGRICFRQARALAEAGYQVTIIGPNPTDEMVMGISIRGIVKPSSRLFRMLGVFRILSMAWREQADIYHFHDPELLFLGAFLRLFRRVPVIYDVHEHYPKTILDKKWIPGPLRKLTSRAFSLLERVLVPVIGRVIYVTPLIGERYLRMRCSAVQISNYPPVDLFTPGTNMSGGERSQNIIFHGGMTEIRGIRELLQALALVRPDFPSARLHLLGFFSGPVFKEEITEETARLCLNENIQIEEWVPLEEINSRLQNCGIGVIPYLPIENHLVTLATKLFEFMAAGMAVIAPDYPLYRQIVAGCNCGLLVDPTRPEDIAAALRELLTEPEKAFQMGQKGRKFFLQEYNWDREKIKLLGFYRSLAAVHSPGEGNL